MYAKDFEYDGQSLSDYNCIVCDFDGSPGTKTVSAGSSITFNKIQRNSGKLHTLASVSYNECMTATFDICKDPDSLLTDDTFLTSDECRDLMRWLNRREFHKFRVFYDDEDIETFYFNASFNIEKITIGEKVCGLRLTMESDRPYAYGETQKFTITATRTTLAKSHLIKDVSDDIGDIYPTVKIVCHAAGTLEITNTTMGITTHIQGCVVGEEIIIDGENLIITTSENRNIWDSFNYVFPQLTNSLSNRVNSFVVSLPSTIEISYDPIIKETF